MREWVLVPEAQSSEWERLVEQAIGWVDEPVVQLPGEGEVVSESETRSSRIKVARDELLISESSYAPDQQVARPHVHREHADAFYVLDGELLFHVAGESRALPAGAFALAPPELVHGFDVGEKGVRHLNLHTPGRAFAAFSRARRDGVPFDAADGDTFGPPEGGGLPASDAVVWMAGEGEIVGTSLAKAARPELSLLEFQIRPGGGVGPHFHKGHSDSFYVLEGEVEFHVGDAVVAGRAGAYVLAPPGVVHFFRNVSDRPAKALNLHTPGGFVEYRRELVALQEQGIEPDAAFFEHHDVFDVDWIAGYSPIVKAIWQGRMIQTAAKVGDQAPMAAVCCNACRTCATTNLLALAMGAGAGVVYGAARLAKRVVSRAS